MAKRVETPFDMWDFAPEEVPLAFVFTELQTQHLRNELALVAQKKMGLAFRPESPNAREEMMLENEYLRGQVDILMFILSISEDSKNQVIEQLKERQESQENE